MLCKSQTLKIKCVKGLGILSLLSHCGPHHVEAFSTSSFLQSSRPGCHSTTTSLNVEWETVEHFSVPAGETHEVTSSLDKVGLYRVGLDGAVGYGTEGGTVEITQNYHDSVVAKVLLMPEKSSDYRMAYVGKINVPGEAQKLVVANKSNFPAQMVLSYTPELGDATGIYPDVNPGDSLTGSYAANREAFVLKKSSEPGTFTLENHERPDKGFKIEFSHTNHWSSADTRGVAAWDSASESWTLTVVETVSTFATYDGNAEQ